MTASPGFIYVLTREGIFQYSKSDFSFVSKIDGPFDQNSKIDYSAGANRLVCISGTNVMFYTLQSPPPGTLIPN